jgi:hypothetical protein
MDVVHVSETTGEDMIFNVGILIFLFYANVTFVWKKPFSQSGIYRNSYRSVYVRIM